MKAGATAPERPARMQVTRSNLQRIILPIYGVISDDNSKPPEVLSTGILVAELEP